MIKCLNKQLPLFNMPFTMPFLLKISLIIRFQLILKCVKYSHTLSNRIKIWWFHHYLARLLNFEISYLKIKVILNLNDKFLLLIF